MALPKLLQKLFTNGGAGDKLNQDIIPNIPYSKVTDAPSVDSALSSTSENPVQNKVINSALDGKLSTSGGMMTGSITINNSLAGVIKADDNGSLVLAGGNKASSGGSGCAILWLGGGNDSSSFNAPGEFSLEASKGTWGQPGFSSHQLRGKPDGSLTWCGAPVWCGNANWSNRTNLTIGQSFTAPSRGFVYAKGHSTSSWGALHISVNGIHILGATGKETDTGGTAYVNAGDTVIVSKDGTVNSESAIFVPVQ